MIKVDVLIQEKKWKKYISNPSRYLKKEANKIKNLIPKVKNKKVSFSVLLTGNENIKKLNKQFRNKNKPTDILSFPINRKKKLENNSYLGDIIISFNYMNKPKKQKVKIFKNKVIKTFIHGFLHLLGFDHLVLKDYKKMLKEEEKIYQSVIKKIN